MASHNSPTLFSQLNFPIHPNSPVHTALHTSLQPQVTKSTSTCLQPSMRIKMNQIHYCHTKLQPHAHVSNSPPSTHITRLLPTALHKLSNPDLQPHASLNRNLQPHPQRSKSMPTQIYSRMHTSANPAERPYHHTVAYSPAQLIKPIPTPTPTRTPTPTLTPTPTPIPTPPPTPTCLPAYLPTCLPAYLTYYVSFYS